MPGLGPQQTLTLTVHWDGQTHRLRLEMKMHENVHIDKYVCMGNIEYPTCFCTASASEWVELNTDTVRE